MGLEKLNMKIIHFCMNKENILWKQGWLKKVVETMKSFSSTQIFT